MKMNLRNKKKKNGTGSSYLLIKVSGVVIKGFMLHMPLAAGNISAVFFFCVSVHMCRQKET